MTASTGHTTSLAQHVGELATEAIGNLAGSVAAPRTAATKLRGLLLAPRTLTGLGVLLAAFAVGRRRGKRRT
jgi:hypothetical protein